MSAIFHHGDPLMVDHTPAAAMTAGDTIMIGVTQVVAHVDIAAGALGAVGWPNGTAAYRVGLKTGAVFAIGDKVKVTIATGLADPLNDETFGYAVVAADQTAGDTFVYATHERIAAADA